MASEELISNTCDGNVPANVMNIDGNVEILPVSICHIVRISPGEESSAKEQNLHSKVLAGDDYDSPFSSSAQNASQARVRKKRRPYSPELITSNISKSSTKPKQKKKEILYEIKAETDDTKSFSCDRCQSSFIVNPARCHLPPSQLKKKPSRRKKFDPVTNKILNLCNACGIALSRPPKQPKKCQKIASVEDRQKYFAQATSFATAIAERVQNPVAKRLFCPSFKSKPCACIQTYLTHQDVSDKDTLEGRVETLLKLLKTANHLRRRKNVLLNDHNAEEKNNNPDNLNAVERRQQQQEFEQFVLETRHLLRDKLRLCERACQRLLLYSNNFLHKKPKSELGSRISRQPGRALVNQLVSIDELSTISCCSDMCSRIARSHTTLLKEWRKQAAQGQRQARRVLAEMLTPSGGTKANCYKFISMVTGCGFSTISSVSHQMRITKGDREPPEHGLKKWYRDNPRKKTLAVTLQPYSSPSNVNNTSSVTVNSQILDTQSPNFLPGPSLGLEVQQQQQELNQCHQIIDQHLQQTLICNSSNMDKTWNPNNDTKPKDKEYVSSVSIQETSHLDILPSADSVQLLDLIPGTYLAVPTDFNSSFLTVTPADPKYTRANLSDSHVTINAGILHHVAPSRRVAFTSDFGVHSILNIPSEAGSTSTVITDAETGSHLDIQYVTIPSETCLPIAMGDHHTSSPQVSELSSLETSQCVSSNSSISNSVSVITTTAIQPCKPIDELSNSVSTHHDSSCGLNDEDPSPCHQDSLCVTPSISSVLLLPKPSDTQDPSLGTFEKFF